jgi:hypothetical protein
MAFSFFLVPFVALLTIGAAFSTPLECQPASVVPNWPTYHVMNAVGKGPPFPTGCSPVPRTDLCVEHLNDANAIFEYKGVYHVMNQGGFQVNGTGKVNWTHAVSNDLVRWYRVEDSIPHGIQGACDGTASFPGGPEGSAPVIMWGPDCADGTGFPHYESESGLKDYPRAAVARPADPTSPHLIKWVKGPSNVSFTNGSTQTEPCSFPGKVWKSEVGEYYNMLCSPHWTGNWGGSWARYTSTDASLQTWTLADPLFIIHDSGSPPFGWHIDAASGAMFNPIPNAAAGGPTHMINGVTGQAFWLGSYDPKTEKFTIGNQDQLQWLDIGGGGGGFSGGAAHWAATSNSFKTRPASADNRLLWSAWVSSGGRGNPNVLSLVRELSWDAAASVLTSFPVPEYVTLHNNTYAKDLHLGPILPGTTKALAIPAGGAGGALDLQISFDISKAAPTDSFSHFGVALRAPAVGIDGAAQNVWFVVGPARSKGVRQVWVAGVMNGPGPPLPPKPYPCHRNVCPSNATMVYPHETLGEEMPRGVLCGVKGIQYLTRALSLPSLRSLYYLLDLRVLVDRPVVEVFVMGGRIAWVHNDNTFDINNTSVHVYNHGQGKSIIATNISAYGMGCGWRDDLPPPKTIGKEAMHALK